MSVNLPDVLKNFSRFIECLVGQPPALFLDYDGTLTEIAAKPQDAKLSSEVRELLRELSKKCPVAIVSGRDRQDVEDLVALGNLYFAGSHGFDIRGPGGYSYVHPKGEACLPDLEGAERHLRTTLPEESGILIERKRFAIAIHYRSAASGELASKAQQTAQAIVEASPNLRLRPGKMIVELQPKANWHKGYAVGHLLELLNSSSRSATVPFQPIYLGDDVTDEDAFKALNGEFQIEGGGKIPAGQGILVGTELKSDTSANWTLASPTKVAEFLRCLDEHLKVIRSVGRTLE